jgi:hypothetical protein
METERREGLFQLPFGQISLTSRCNSLPAHPGTHSVTPRLPFHLPLKHLEASSSQRVRVKKRGYNFKRIFHRVHHHRAQLTARYAIKKRLIVS